MAHSARCVPDDEFSPRALTCPKPAIWDPSHLKPLLTLEGVRRQRPPCMCLSAMRCKHNASAMKPCLSIRVVYSGHFAHRRQTKANLPARAPGNKRVTPHLDDLATDMLTQSSSKRRGRWPARIARQLSVVQVTKLR